MVGTVHRAPDGVGTDEAGFDAALGDLHLLAAVHAHTPHQALGHDTDDVARHHLGRNAQVLDTLKAAQRRVGVQRGEHLVARHGGAEGHFGGVLVAHLAHQDDVRILAHERAHAVGKVDLAAVRDGGLPDTRDGVLDRVLQRHDVDAFVVHVAEHRVQRGRLARARGAGHQNDALGPRQHQVQQVVLVFRQSQLSVFDNAALGIEHAQHEVFAMDGGLHCGAKVHAAPADGQRHPPVLRRTALGNVHARHQLEAHQHGVPVAAMQHAHLAQHAVDAVADTQELALGLEVDVGGQLVHRVRQQSVHQTHHRVAVAALSLRERGHVDLAGLDLLDDAVDGQLIAVELVDGGQHIGRTGQAPRDGHPQSHMRTDLVARNDVVGLGAGQHELLRLRVERDRKDLEAQGHGLGQARQCLGVSEHRLQLDGLLAQRLAQGLAHGLFGDKPQGDQRITELFAGLALFQQSDLDLVGRHQPHVLEPVAQAHGWLACGRCVRRGSGLCVAHCVHSSCSSSMRRSTARTGTPDAPDAPCCSAWRYMRKASS